MSQAARIQKSTTEINAPVAAHGDFLLSQIMILLHGIRPAMADGRAYDPDTTLGDVGFTSLEMVNVMLAVESAFDLMIPAGDITPGNFKTAAAIAAMVGRLKPAA